MPTAGRPQPRPGERRHNPLIVAVSIAAGCVLLAAALIAAASVDRAWVRSKSQQNDEERSRRAASEEFEKSAFERQVADLERAASDLEARIKQIKTSAEAARIQKQALENARSAANKIDGLEAGTLANAVPDTALEGRFVELEQKLTALKAQRERMVTERTLPPQEELSLSSRYNFTMLAAIIPLLLLSGYTLYLILLHPLSSSLLDGYTDLEKRSMLFSGSCLILAPTLFLTLVWIFTIV